MPGWIGQLYLTSNRPQHINLDIGTLCHGHVVNNAEENFMLKVRKCIFVFCSFVRFAHETT